MAAADQPIDYIEVGNTEVIHEHESATFAQTFPMYTAVEIKIDGHWQTGMSGYSQEHPARRRRTSSSRRSPGVHRPV